MRPDRLIASVFLAIAVLLPAQVSADDARDRAARDLLRYVNEQRALNGAGPLTINERLNGAAQKHAEDMVRRDYFDHRSPDGRGLQERITSAGYPWRVIAENLAAGQSSPRGTVETWMTSPGHRDNMLDRDYLEAGIGYARPAGDGKRPRYAHYWVVVFGARSR